MRYGLELSNAGVGADPHILAELAFLAEMSGWDGVFLEDYIVHWSAPDIPTCDPWVALAAIALRTTYVRLGTTVTPLSRRRPWKLAREAVTLDHLSHGRLTLGVGLGDLQDPGFGSVGEVTDAHQRAALLDEALDIITGLWTGQPFSYHGTHYQVDNLTFRPTPLQIPRIPIWVGGNWPHSGPITRAARWDGFVGGKAHAPDEPWCLTETEVTTLKAAIMYQRTTSAPFDIAVGGAPRDPDTNQARAAIRALADAGATWWMEFVPSSDLATMRAAITHGPLWID